MSNINPKIKEIIQKTLIIKYFDRHFEKIERMVSSVNQYNRNEFYSKYLGVEDLLKYEYYKKLHDLLYVKDIISSNIVWRRIGRMEDGGYVMPFFTKNQQISDDINMPCNMPTPTAYSIGISRDVSWDNDMANLGYDIYMYDHTINALPEKNQKFHWKKRGIEGKQTNNKKLMTLDEMIMINGHVNNKNMVLKMDVEGYEWDVLENINTNTLKQFDIIVMELHGLTENEEVGLYCANKSKIIRALENINASHQLVHIHANNMAQLVDYCGNLMMPSSLEVTFVIKDSYEFGENTRMFPTELDRRCDTAIPDIFLGTWN